MMRSVWVSMISDPFSVSTWFPRPSRRPTPGYPTTESPSATDSETTQKPFEKARRFGERHVQPLATSMRMGFLIYTARISASSDALDRNRPMTAQQISLRISAMGGSIARFAALRQPDRFYDRDRFAETAEEIWNDILHWHDVSGEPLHAA